MSRVSTKRFTEIQNSYMRVWKAFTEAAQAQGLRAEADSGMGAVVVQRGETTQAEAILLMPNWPWKAVSNKKSVDIAVKVTERFAPDLTHITHSTTCIAYLWRDEKASRPLLELHYDFETPVREAHPVFHVQIGTTDWPEDKLRKMGLPVPIKRDAQKDYGNARIPTAFMGYIPSLVALAADHLKPKSFRLMMDEARICSVTSAPLCKSLLDSLGSGQSPHAHHWYDDRYVVHLWQDGGKNRASVPVLKEKWSDAAASRSAVAKALGVAPSRLFVIDEAPQP